MLCQPGKLLNAGTGVVGHLAGSAAMARHNRKGRSKSGGRFVRLDHYMLKSEAWKHLSPTACKVLVDVWRRHDGTNNGFIAYSVREAADIGVARSPASRALLELQELGFLKCSQLSGFDQKRMARTWALTAEATSNAPPARDFQKWRNSKHSPSGGTHSPSRGTVTPKCRTEGKATVPVGGLYGQKTTPHSPSGGTLIESTIGLGRSHSTAQGQKPYGHSHAQLASRFGDDGWPVLTAISPDLVDKLAEKLSANTLTNADLDAARQEAGL